MQQRDELITLLHRAEASEDLPEITPQPELWYEPFPLTDIQHAYWVGRSPVVELGGVSAHFYLEFEPEGLELRRLSDSLQKVIERHGMLRAVIGPDGQQRILREVPRYEISVSDLRGKALTAQEAEIARIRAEMDHQVLPADRWPLFDIRASRLDERRLRLHVSIDILIIDAFSVELMYRDWRRFYENPGWAPEPLELSFRDYVLAEESLRTGSRFRNAKEYWLRRLDTLPPAPALPLLRQPAQVARTEFTRHRYRLPRERWDAIKEAAQRRGLTPNTVLIAAFADVLRLWSNQPRFTLNLTLFNRPPLHPQIGRIIGDFTSVTLLAVEAAQADDSFAARAEQIHRQLIRDLEHVAFSGVRLLRERARRLGGRPSAAMPIVFTSWLGLATAEDTSGGSRFGREVYGISQTPQVWLDHQVMEEQGDLVFNWDAVAALFPPGLLDDMFSAYCGLLNRLSQDEAGWDEEGPLLELPAWQAQERENANATSADIPARTLCDLVAVQARQRPDSIAVIADDGQFTYREVVERARRLARCLLRLGTARGTLVGIVMDKGREQVTAVLGITQAAAAYLPVDPEWPQARRWQLLDEGGVRVVVTTTQLRDKLTWPADIRVVTFADADVREADPSPLDIEPSPRDLAYVIFTSGSTGKPKGVMIDHGGASNTILDINSRFEIGTGDRVLALSALSFDLSVYDIFGVLAAGGTVVIPSAERLRDPAHWSDLMQRHQVTIWNSVPALMQAWVDAHGAEGALAGSSLRVVMLSGDWIPVALPGAVRALQPDAQVISLGGATEASIWSIWYPIGEIPPEWSRIPYGKPLANQTFHVYDKQLMPCPVWTTGELFIGGTGVAKGYWADPERSRERFITHPHTGERLYRTGDLGRYLPGGDIEFLGRDDFQVKLHGYRIELGEIAAALRKQPGVGEALVTVATSPATGSRQLVAYVIPARGPDAPAGADGGAVPWDVVTEEGEAELRQGLRDIAHDLAIYQRTWREVEALCPLIMARTLARLGLFTQPGDSVRAGDMAERCGIKPQYSGLVRRWMSALAGQGTLSSTGRPGEYRCEQGFDAAQLHRQVQQGLSALGESQEDPEAHGHPGVSRVLTEYFIRLAEKQVEMLRGEVSPLEFLLPGGGVQVADTLYSDNPPAQLVNRIITRVIRSFVDGFTADRPVRILEVGAGTGATSAHLMPQLPADRVRYHFTDISAYFTELARRKFSAYPFIDYGLFDIDREPTSQGIPLGSADIIVAAQVVHNAKNISRTLEYLRSVLVPGGLLVLTEGTANWQIHMVTIGFVQDYSAYEDNRDPLLSVAQWRKKLESAGFVRFAAIPGSCATTDLLNQHVLISEAPAGRRRPDPALLRDALGQMLPDYMIPQHYILIDRLPLSANGKVDGAALPSPWGSTVPREPVAPRDEVEQMLLEIWRDALARDDFGVEDNFFELGGDSLHAVRILGRLRDELGVQGNAEENLQRLFENPTIAGLAAVLRKATEAPA